MSVKAKATITLTRVNDGAPGRTYFIEASSNVLKRSKDNSIIPGHIEFRAYYRDGDKASRTAYAGRFVIEETADGNTWKTIYTSATNEVSVNHSVYSIVVDGKGQSIADRAGNQIGIARDISQIRCKFYAAGGTTQLLDMQRVAVVVDVDALTHEEIFNLLTQDGVIKGIYKEGNQLFISFTYAKGGSLTLGGKNNGNGLLKILDASGSQVGYIDNTGVHFIKGEFSGELKAATGTFSGKLSALVGGVIGGWEIDPVKQTLTAPTKKIILDAKNNQIITAANSPYGNKTVITDKISYIPNLNIQDSLRVSSPGGILCEVGTDSKISFYNGFSDGSHPMPDDNMYLNGNLKVTGTKNREIKTRNYSNRLQYCYEMASPMFGDIGEAEMDESGICYVYLDDIFAETVNVNTEYQVFLQKEGQGDLWVEAKNTEYFVVKGTPRLKFSWEIKVKQKGYEHDRLNESIDIDDQIEYIQYIREGQSLFNEYCQEMEEI